MKAEYQQYLKIAESIRRGTILAGFNMEKELAEIQAGMNLICMDGQ